MQYLITFEQTERGFSARVPDFPGLVRTGPDQWTALQEVQAALREHLAALTQAGQPLPEPATYSVQIDLESLAEPEPAAASDPFHRLVDHVLHSCYPEGIPLWAEPVRDCLALVQDIEEVADACDAVANHVEPDIDDEDEEFDDDQDLDEEDANTEDDLDDEDAEDDDDDDDDDDEDELFDGLCGGKIGDLKLTLTTFLEHFVTVQPYFESVLPIDAVFDSGLPNLVELDYSLETLKRLAALVPHRMRAIRESGDNLPLAAFFCFWLSRAAAMMLTMTSGYDMIRIMDCGDDDCGCCDCEDCDCDCEDCGGGDCDCDDDCDCHDHDHDDDHPAGGHGGPKGKPRQ